MNINVNDILKKSENFEQNSPYFQWVSSGVMQFQQMRPSSRQEHITSSS